MNRKANGNNCVRYREDGLETGVERTGKSGNYRYNGKICFRMRNGKVRTIRSRKWKTSLPAARWYQNYLKRLHKRSTWAHNPKSVNFPVFPPLKKVLLSSSEKRHSEISHADIGATF